MIKITGHHVPKELIWNFAWTEKAEMKRLCFSSHKVLVIF